MRLRTNAIVTGRLMSSDKASQLPERVKFSGRILFLTDDTTLIRQQLEATGDEPRASKPNSPRVSQTTTCR